MDTNAVSLVLEPSTDNYVKGKGQPLQHTLQAALHGNVQCKPTKQHVWPGAFTLDTNKQQQQQRQQQSDDIMMITNIFIDDNSLFGIVHEDCFPPSIADPCEVLHIVFL